MKKNQKILTFDIEKWLWKSDLVEMCLFLEIVALIEFTQLNWFNNDFQDKIQ